MFRRDFLIGGAISSTFSFGGVRAALARTPEPGPALPVPGSTDPAQLAATLLATDRDQVVPLALRWVGEGASARDLLGAALLAGTQEVGPRPIGGQVHAMMMVASAAQVTARLRGKEAWLPALFNLDRVKHSQARDARQDWRMPAAPEPDPRPVAALAADFDRAVAAWDQTAADRLAVSLHATTSLSEFFELLWPWAARDFRVIGHKAIYATQAFRALHDLGWRQGRDVVRSVLIGILDENPYDSSTPEQARAILDLHPTNRARAGELPESWERGGSDPEVSRALCAALRETTPEAASAEVVAAARTGASAATLWDAVRLSAFESVLRLPTIGGVHPVTTVNALRRAGEHARTEATRRLQLLQAASWMRLFAPMVARGDRERAALRIDEVAPGGAGDPFAGAGEAERRGRAARCLADGDLEGFAQRACSVLARKAKEDHDYKFAAAAIEEIEAAAPALRPCLAGAAMSFLRAEDAADAAVYLRAEPLLKR